MVSHPSRIAAPFVVAGVIAAGALLPTLRAAASPNLPAISPHHLVEKVLAEKVSHLSGTFQWRAVLGLPSLSGLTSGAGQSVSTSSGFDPTSLLSGTHSFKIWINGPERQRVAAPGTLSESDVVHRGNQAWVYDSSTNHVTHYVQRPGSSTRSMAQPLDGVAVTALADNLLRGVRSVGTRVSVGRTVEVAGRAAYVLRLTPDRSVAANRASTVAAATIAVDAKTGLALRVAIYAVGQSSPALQVGFTTISYATPSASMFAVPTGQTTTLKVVGPVGSAHRMAGGEAPARTAANGRASSSVGRDWGTIANLSAGAPSTGAVSGRLGTRELDAVTTVVAGSWGAGRLLQSTLVNALFLGNGRVLVGLVTPHALEAAAGQLGH